MKRIERLGQTQSTRVQIVDMFTHEYANQPHFFFEASTEQIRDVGETGEIEDTDNDIEIGYSTHERPDCNTSEYAIAMGCNIIEKHIGIVCFSIGKACFSVGKWACMPN